MNEREASIITNDYILDVDYGSWACGDGCCTDWWVDLRLSRRNEYNILSLLDANEIRDIEWYDFRDNDDIQIVLEWVNGWYESRRSYCDLPAITFTAENLTIR